jgi:hypothetical protein
MGEAHVHGTLVPWSLVVKIFDLVGEGLKAASADPATWDYWKREWLAYQAPWLQEMQGSLVAPRCLGAADHPGVVAWLAMEDLSHVDERPWPHTRFQTVARHVGAFNGAYLVGRPMPRDSWLSHGWLRGWTERAEPMVALLPTVADHAVVREIFAEATITELLRLWEERNAFFDALDALPQTLCHQDIFPRNVFVRETVHGNQTVAIDWAFVGQGAIGEELGALVGASLAFFEADPARAEELETHCLQGYLDGLRDAGWHGDAADVRFGYLAAIVLRFGVGALAPVLTVALDESLHHVWEQIMGKPLREITRNARRTTDFYEQRIAEARRLLAAR